MDNWIIIAIVATGFVAGFINTVAGSGSLLTLPLLISIGLPPNVANATNRVAILLQNVVGVSSFKQKKVLNLKTDYRLAIPAIIGSIPGAVFAVKISGDVLEKTIGVLLVVMFFLIITKPDKWVKDQAGAISKKPTPVQYVIFFLIGMYGGFIQAGVGFFLLGGLVLSAGYDLVKANAVKVFIVLAYTFVALLIFMYKDLVDYKAGLILAAGNMLGAWAGARFAVKRGPQYIRYFLLLAILAAAIKLFGFI